jgi:NDP-sugar pyrophosphorylase family protein
MHQGPTCVRADQNKHAILATMRRLGVHQMPVLDNRGCVVGLATVNDYLNVLPRDNWVVIMAGGLGSRLQALTMDTPKPMLKVGPRPMLETIVNAYADQGFHQFYFAVNYKAEQIEAHFGNGREFGVKIEYLREEKRLGTAGALSLLPDRPTEPFLVTNADLLTKVDFGAMVDQHVAEGADATMAVRQYEMQVPFGVVRVRDGAIEAIEEKPMQPFIVSAGMYVLSPSMLHLLTRNGYLDMPTLFASIIARGLRTRCHYVDGYWLDIGRLPDYERANVDFAELFR